MKDPALQVALDWREKSKPNAAWAQRYHPEFDTAMSFLDASVDARDREAREREQLRRREVSYKRTKLVAFIIALLFLLSLAASVYAYKKNAETQTALRKMEDANKQANDERKNAVRERDRANKLAEDAKRNEKIAQYAKETAIEKKKESEGLKADAERQAPSWFLEG